MLALLSLIRVLRQLLFYVPTKDPLRRDLGLFGQVGAIPIYLFIAYSILLSFNCLFDQSSPKTHNTVILDMSSTEFDIGRFIPLTRVQVQSWKDPTKHETFFTTNWEENHMWPQEPVLVKLREGAFGIPWLGPLERDDETLMKRMLQLSPTAAMPWKVLTQFYISNNNWPAATHSAKQYFVYYPDDTATALTLSGVFLGVNKGREAVDILEPVIRRHPQYELQMQLGWILGQEPDEQDRKRGLEYVQGALKLKSDDWKGYYTEGFVLMWNGREADALVSFEHAAILNPNFPEIQQEMFRLRKKLHGA